MGRKERRSLQRKRRRKNSDPKMPVKARPSADLRSDTIPLTYHVVCLLDILGQSTGLRKWSSIPSSPEPPADFLRAIKDTAGRVERFRIDFERHFHAFESEGIASHSKLLTREQRDQLLRFRDSRLKTQQFSDTFVFYAPLRNSYGDISVTPVYRILAASCMAMIMSLATGVAVRGAVCIGAGMELHPNTFYGPALADAHSLESKISDYPRVVVADEVEHFIRSSGFSPVPGIEVGMKGLADACLGMICRDSDGKLMADFMGNFVRSLANPPEGAVLDAVSRAYQFVDSERVRFESCRDTKLADRYNRLQRYMETRLMLWGIKSSVRAEE